MTKKASTPQLNPRPNLQRRQKSRMLTTSQATKRRQTSRWAVRPLLSLRTAKMLRPKSESSSNRSRTQPKDGRPSKARAAAIKHHLWVVEPKRHRSPAQQSDNRRALPRQQVPTSNSAENPKHSKRNQRRRKSMKTSLKLGVSLNNSKESKMKNKF